jgi:serine phosphatase RsbU (regulator of sigma subunit)
MKRHLYSHFKIWLVLGSGALLALTLCVQCIGTYLYANAVLVPQQAQREAERQAVALNTAVRDAGIADPRTLGPIIDQALASASGRVLWMRMLDSDRNVFAQGGNAGRQADIPADWREKLEKHESVAVQVDTREGKALVAVLPFRMARPLRPPAGDSHWIDQRSGPADRHAPYLIELAIPLKAVTGELDGLRKHLIIGIIASIALLISVAVIGLRLPQYLRGKHLEGEMRLARRVQRDLQPKPDSISADFVFAASTVSAGEVGGDFYDIFEASAGKTAIVLGDVSGKGVSAALLVSVLQGAIRSSTSAQHEFACERINQMLCELTAQARFATLFWGVFDAASGTLRYVNAGHEGPMLIRRGQNQIERLDHGGPVLGLLPCARYSAGSVRIDPSDTLLIYSDGITEAANGNEEEFGEDRLKDIISRAGETWPKELCDQIMTGVSTFSSAGPEPDDRTLLVIEFQPAWDTLSRREAELVTIGAAS